MDMINNRQMLETWLREASRLLASPAYRLGESYDTNKQHGPLPSDQEFEEFTMRLGYFSDLVVEPRQIPFLGYNLCSELGVAAGPLLDSRWIERYAKLGYSILMYKTVRSASHASHRWPNMICVDVNEYLESDLPEHVVCRRNSVCEGQVTITNSFGMPSAEPYGEHGWMADVRRAKSYLRAGQILGVSVVGTPTPNGTLEHLADDFARCAVLALDAGADVIEANLSCPNVIGEEGNLYENPEAAALIMRTTRQSIGATPLAAKLGYFTDLAMLRSVVQGIAESVNIIVAINSVKLKVITPDGKPALGKERTESGICGYGIRNLGLQTTKELSRLRREENLEYKIIGCGGVFSVLDIQEYLKCGADLVQTATGALWRPQLAAEWNSQLQESS